MSSLTGASPGPRPARGPRTVGPLLAASVVLLGATPGLVRMAPLDRDEARFAESTAQMLESGDYIDPRFQDAPRDKKPAGVNWAQALSVRLTSDVEARAIWAYRLPSLIGAMLAAAAAAWGAQAFFPPWRAASAGVALASGWLLMSEAGVAKADALLCGAVTLALAAFGHIYAAARRGAESERWAKALLWIGLALSILVKGPVGPIVFVACAVSLWIADHAAPWARRISWRWGLLFLLAAVGPWAAAVTVSSDGGFWWGSLGQDVAAKLTGVRESHYGPPGFYLLLLPVLAFPASGLLPAAAAYAWRYRREPAARFAVSWILLTWLLFELAPTKLAHYPLPLYGGWALLVAGALGVPSGRLARWTGAALSLLAGATLAAAAIVLAARFGAGVQAQVWGIAVAVLVFGAGTAGAVGTLSGASGADLGHRLSWFCAALVLSTAAHAAAGGGLLPSLAKLWPSQAAAELLDRANLDPRNGVTPGPVAVAGYAEPSLVFLLGADTDLGDGDDAAEAVESGRPALVEARQAPAFLARLARDHVAARSPGAVSGFDYSDGRQVTLRLWVRR